MDASTATKKRVSRRIIRISGVVQGVGFRPFVASLARRFAVRGWVRNTSGSAEIDAEAPSDVLDTFVCAIRNEAPSLARVASISSIEADPVGYTSFVIRESKAVSGVRCVIPADVATCPECLREIANPSDRRYRYEFTNCTHCGPRFTIVQRIPYDRENTTMSAFQMCPSCTNEYNDPNNRRYHAEPIACPECGPRVWLEHDGKVEDCEPLRKAGELLSRGAIVAIKGLGGFHLACDAANDNAVRILRTRKNRVAKPFAIMVKDIEEAEKVCELSAAARELMMSGRRPIVLARKRPLSGISNEIAPGSRNLGVMLPYTPLHVLLFEYSPAALVMTSGNLSEEPLVFTNTTAREKLGALADAFLMHNRDIHVPCDDSVVRADCVGEPILIRRARGYVPEAIDLPFEVPKILAVGAQQKNTLCLAWDRQAVLSQHIGDLDTAETLDYFKYVADHFMSLLKMQPEVVAYDQHPEYLSTRYALEVNAGSRIGVQHHHAHIAACLAENGSTEQCIGIALDGTGYGNDGTVWGGEILAVDLVDFQRLGCFAPVRMPGGEAAIRDPRRMAMAYLHAAYGEKCLQIAELLGLRFADLETRIVKHQIETGFNSPLTSSAGRLFDALSAALGICRERSYEGQPAAELEAVVDEFEEGFYNGKLSFVDGFLYLDFVPAFRDAIEDFLSGTCAGIVAARFHNTVVELLAKACGEIRDKAGLCLVALSGGVFQNAVIADRLAARLRSAGFKVLTHKRLPPNDACISFGQAMVAGSRSMKG
jgi:hydrogenase maturation protein HypF